MIQRLRGLFWPRSLQGQLLLAVALALLLAQGISAALLYRAQTERRDAALIHTAALRLFFAARDEGLIDGPGELYSVEIQEVMPIRNSTTTIAVNLSTPSTSIRIFT